FADTYLYVIRPVNAKVLQYLRETKANADEYKTLEERRTGVQVAFYLMFAAIALTFVTAAIWIGMWFANRLVAPIRQLMGAAKQISTGNLDVGVDGLPPHHALAALARTVTNLTSQ